MPNPGSNNGATGAVQRREQRRCSRRKVLERGEMVHVELGPTESALLLDLSPKGISVQGKKPLTPGLRLSLRFQLPGSQISLQPTYEVVWAEKNGKIGLKFLYMAEREQRQLEQWLSVQNVEAGEPLSITSPVVITPIPINGDEAEAAQAAMAAPVPSPAAAPEDDRAPARQTGGGGPGPVDSELITLELDEALVRLVQQAYSTTHADGAALAIRTDEAVICRASVGDAPDVGMHLNPNSGLSGECFRTGAVVVCADAADDSRVDPAVARQLNLRSVLIVPIRVGDTTAGLLEVLSSKPSAFDAAHLASLSHIVEIAGVLLEDTVVPAQREASGPAATKVVAAPAKSEVLETPVVPDSPRSITASSQSAEDAAIAGIIELLGPELRELGEAPAKPPAIEAAPARPSPAIPQFKIPPPRPQPSITEPAPAAVVRTPFAGVARRAAASAWTKRNRTMVLIALGCVVLVAAAVWGIRVAWSSSTRARIAPPAAQPSAPAPTVPAPAPAAITVMPTGPTLPATRQSGRDEKQSNKPSTASEEDLGDSVTVLRLPTDNKPSTPAESVSSAPPPLPQANANTVALPRLEPRVATPVPAPTGPAGPETATLAGPLRVSGEVMRTRVVSQPSPIYPSFARDAGIQGDVVLGIMVGADGRVTSVRVMSGQQFLAQAAVDAVRRWRYQPYLLHGKPIAVDTTVTVRFTIPRR